MTDISRRGLIGAGATGVVVGVLGPGPSAEAAHRRRRRRKHRRKVAKRPTDLYARSRYAGLLDATFTLTGAAGAATVTLTGVRDLPSAAAGADGCFALTFRSPTAGPPQGTYTLRRDGFAATDLFVVPDRGRRSYQAVVNRTG
jgi:hypothetical protein